MPGEKVSAIARRVICTYIDLKQNIRELQLREIDLVGKHKRYDDTQGERTQVYVFKHGHRVQDLSCSVLEEQVHPNDEELASILYNDTEWDRLRVALPHLAKRHECAVNELQETLEKDSKVELMEALLKELEKTDVPIGELILDSLGIPQNGENGYLNSQWLYWREEQHVALAEITNCSKKHAKDVAQGRHNLDTETKQAVDDRDGEECVRCSVKDGLVYHHIILAQDGGSSDLENIALLCKDCHKKAHGDSWSSTVYTSREEFWQWTKSN